MNVLLCKKTGVVYENNEHNREVLEYQVMEYHKEAEKTTTIHLNNNELLFLYDVLRRVSGSPEYSRRKHQVTIVNKIHEVIDVDNDKIFADVTGSIEFRTIYKTNP